MEHDFDGIEPIIALTQPSGWSIQPAESAAAPAMIAVEHLRKVHPATHAIYEWREYWVRHEGAASVTAGGISLPKLPGNAFKLLLENRVGLVTLEAFDAANHHIAPPNHLLALSGKLPTIEAHEQFFARLLDDLFARLASLPFTIAAETSQHVRETLRPPEPIFALHFFTHEADQIAAALRTIQAAPHRTLVTEVQLRPLHDITELGIDTLLDIIQSPERWSRTPGSTTTLARRLNDHLPELVRQDRSLDSLDTPENRFAVGAVRLFAQELGTLRRHPWWPNVPPVSRSRLRIATEAVTAFLELPMVREIGPMTRVPAASRVLLKRDGYRDLFALWMSFQQSKRPLFAALDQTIALRDVASLYEMWVYFRLIDEIALVTGVQPVLDLGYGEQGALGWKSRAHFGSEGTLWYNRQQSAYSRISLRPDMLWEPRVGQPVAFDAKFRMSNAGANNSWNEEDLVKMHAYRDALNVRAAVAIYPGSISRFWSPSSSILGDSTILADVLSPNVTGIGALALQPGEGL